LNLSWHLDISCCSDESHLAYFGTPDNLNVLA